MVKQPVTLGSLFDGSGGFPLAGVINGVIPMWAAEIEPYPISVTRERFPRMMHLGSVLDINGGVIPPVDIITFGSPCQDMSVAGKRAGMQHSAKGDEDTTRSGLFYEAIRIIREMRRATNGKYPTFAVWENVPGAFSSNKGQDFRCVLEELAQIAGGDVSIPQPSGGKWNPAGEIVGDGFSIAWRVLDAQYWGVPQRRKRIYLVADFADERAGSILFERESMPRNTEPGEAQGQAATGDAGGGIDRSGQPCGGYSSHQIIPIHDKATRFNGGGPTRNNDGAGNGLGVGKPGSPSPTLSTCDRHAVVYEPKFAMEENWSQSDVKNALRASASKSSHAVVEPVPCAFHLQQDPISGEISPCISGQGQASVGVFMGGQGAKAGNIGYSEDKSPTLRASSSGSNQVPDIVCAAYDTTQITSPLNYSSPKNGDPCHPLAAQQHAPLAVYGVDCRNGVLDAEKVATLQAHVNGGYSLNSTHPILYPAEGANEDL